MVGNRNQLSAIFTQIAQVSKCHPSPPAHTSINNKKAKLLYLEAGGPDEVRVAAVLQYALCVHRHEVGELARAVR